MLGTDFSHRHSRKVKITNKRQYNTELMCADNWAIYTFGFSSMADVVSKQMCRKIITLGLKINVEPPKNKKKNF